MQSIIETLSLFVDMRLLILPLLALPAAAALSTIQADLAAIGHDVEWAPFPIVISASTSAAVVSNGDVDAIRVFDTGQLVPTTPDILVPFGGVGWAFGISSSPTSLEPLGGVIDLFFDPTPSFDFMVVNADDGVNVSLLHNSGSITLLPAIFTAAGDTSSIFSITDFDPIVAARIEHGGDSGIVIFPELSSIPEPSGSLILGIFGLTAFTGFRRR